MQGIPVSHKRKSIQKIQPQMPTRKVSQKSRNQSRRKHRTQYKGMDTPQVQLTNYKRKNFKILNELDTTKARGHKDPKNTVITERTHQTQFKTEQSISKIPNKGSAQRKRYNNSVNSFKSDTSLGMQTGQIADQRQITSRFTENYHDAEESLTFLIHQAKFNDSNPLINTARLREQQAKQIGSAQSIKNNKKDYKLENQSKPEQKFAQIQYPSNQKAKQKDESIRQTIQESNQNAQQQNQNQQNESNQGQNFDDYEFGGLNQETLRDQNSSAYSKADTKKKGKKILHPPKIQSYIKDGMIHKPQNWRELNRYVPSSLEQNRMALEHYLKQKQQIQSKRQQQQIAKLIQEYQLNKNSVMNLSKRKTQTNKILQKMYQDKRLTNDRHNSVSLPQLRAFSHPKKQIIIPEANEIYTEINSNIKTNEEKYKISNVLAKSFEPERKKSQSSLLRPSLSYTKMGFGSKKSRLLNEEDIKENQIANVQKIQKKLRQKGIQFNSASIRKGLLNIREVPIYKISKSPTDQNNEQIQGNKFDIPARQLPSNAFYKIFPL